MLPPDGVLQSPTSSVIEDSARFKDTLIEAVQAEDLSEVRRILTAIPDHLRKTTLLQPSVKMEHKLQTPLMAGAATGNISIVGAVLASFEELFVGDEDKRQSERRRQKEMKRQMEITDVDDRTLLMHASCSGSSAMFNVISHEVQRKQIRKVLTQQDANGMTFLHHAMNAKSDEDTNFAEPTGRPNSPTSSVLEEWAADPVFVVEPSEAEQPTTHVPNAELLDPWVPVVKSALKFARASLWLPEYRRQLLVRDAWGRSAIEHALNSGRPQLVEVVFDAIRRDVYDEESDVSLRAQDSTVASKIQSFVPGNLIVIFQLLLPETGADPTGPLSLLALLCFIAPLWSWGASMGQGKSDPKLRNTRARVTAAKYALAGPAMFFWGISTSNIGQASFNMSETVSAAVATIIIPALDSFFASGGARQTFSKVSIAILDFWDNLGKKPASKIARARARDLDGDGDDYDKRDVRRRSTFGTTGLELSEASSQRKSLEPPLSALRNAMEERGINAQEALHALTELSPSEHLHSVRSPRSAISKVFDEGETATAEVLGSLNPHQDIQDCKTEAVEALRSLDPRPVLREVVDKGRTSTIRENLEASAAAASAGEAKQSIEARSALREVVEEGKEVAVDAVEGVVAPVTAPDLDPRRSRS
eukprot:g15624.t1